VAGEHHGHHFVAQLAVVEARAVVLIAGAEQHAEHVASFLSGRAPFGDHTVDDLIELAGRALQAQVGRRRNRGRQGHWARDRVDHGSQRTRESAADCVVRVRELRVEQCLHHDFERQTHTLFRHVELLMRRDAGGRLFGACRDLVGVARDAARHERGREQTSALFVLVALEREQASSEQRAREQR
jgi:hypothetical protein